MFPELLISTDPFLAELEAAGMGQIIKENRQQLKAWLEK